MAKAAPLMLQSMRFRDTRHYCWDVGGAGSGCEYVVALACEL